MLQHLISYNMVIFGSKAMYLHFHFDWLVFNANFSNISAILWSYWWRKQTYK